MKKFSALCLLFLTFLQLYAEGGVVFKYKQKKGDSYNHTSTIQEEAYFNGILNNKTQIINRTTTTVKNTLSDGTATLYTHYMTTENYLLAMSGRTLNWGEEADVTIKRTPLGKMFDSDNRFLPTVRGVPGFIDKEIKIGESWTAQGMEVHDLRELFNMTNAIEIPFTAKYTYKGDEEINGKTLNIIDCYYDLLDRPFRNQNINSTYAGTTGYAQQKIYWNNEKGEIDHYTETFEIKFKDIRGNSYIFCSTAHGEVLEYHSVNDDETLLAIQESVKDLENISVKKGERGLTISLDNIQFEPDSNRLMESEIIKLQKLAEILKDYSNDLLVTGHCALRGTEKARQILSEERADTVAQYLIHNKVRDEYHIFTQGKGAREPIASNDTEEGRSKNRRVEITLMD